MITNNPRLVDTTPATDVWEQTLSDDPERGLTAVGVAAWAADLPPLARITSPRPGALTARWHVPADPDPMQEPRP